MHRAGTGGVTDLVGAVLDGRYRVEAPIAEGVLLREHRGRDERDGRVVSLWLPHRALAPAFEDIEAELAAAMPGCRRVLDLGRSTAYVVTAPAEHIGPRPRLSPYPREVVAGWFRALAGIIDRNHRAGRWHGLLTCDDVAILDGKLVVAGFGFWVRADAEAIAAALAEPEASRVRAQCAPELIACAIGPSADLWALGRCTLALAIGSGQPEPLRALQQRHPRLAELLGGLLQVDPDARSGDLRALAEAVTRALEEPYRDDPSVPAPRAAAAPRAVVPVFAPEPEDDTATATYEPGSGVWRGVQPAPLAIPTPLAPQAWSPVTARPAIQMISMKPPDTAARAAARPAPPIAAPMIPVIRKIETVVPHPSRPSPAALGTIAPPRARTQPVQPPRKWPLTLLVVALAIAALGLAAFALWR